MAKTVVDGKGYYPATDLEEAWGLKAKTIRNYASEKVGKIQGCIVLDGQLLVPENAIRPITQPVAQSILWKIIQYKNNPALVPDFASLGISLSQIRAVLSELCRQNYVMEMPSENEASVSALLLNCIISSKGFELVMYKKKLKDNNVPDILTSQNMALAFAAVQTALQVAQLVAALA